MSTKMNVNCVLCDKLFANKSKFYKHRRKVHSLLASHADRSVWNYKCLEPNCDNSFQTSEKLIKHLHQEHNLLFAPTEEVTFTSRSEFESWKTEYEVDSHCNYTVARTWKNNGREITYYHCNRTKKAKPSLQQIRQRRMKKQGSCKLDYACTSQLKLVNDGKKLCVCFQRTHYGHDSDLEHLRISKDDKAKIVSKVIAGVPGARIVESLKSKSEEPIKRIDMLSVKDIANIKRSCKMQNRDDIRHRKYALSLDPWVQVCKVMPQEENPVVFYKKLGEVHHTLKENDFCLAVMNQFQQMMVTKFGCNVISIDGTHGFNNQEYHVTIVMLIDESGQGFPGAFLFSNRKDSCIYEVFFESIRQKVGQISTDIFMSDNTESFYAAWVQVMGPAKRHFFCRWHVDMDWNMNLRSIKNTTKRALTRNALNALQEKRDNFKTRLESVINMMLEDHDTRKLGQYLKSNYLNNYEQWASCYRSSSCISVTKQLELMHETIRNFYLSLRKIRRLDNCLQAVLKYIRDQSVGRILKLVKGDNTIYHQELVKRHQFALKSTFTVRMIRDSCWKVRTNLNRYLVTRLLTSKCCHLVCPECDICLHMFSCTCKDFIFGFKICKHIHYICRLITEEML